MDSSRYAAVFILGFLLIATFSLAGCTDSGGPFSMNQTPKADIEVSKSTVKTGESITFDASGSKDADGRIKKYEWDFNGDGQWDETTSDDIVAHSYPDNGNFTAKLRVKDDAGGTSQAKCKICVLNRAPDVEAFASKYLAVTLEDIDFSVNASDKDGNIVLYQWDFDGDGAWDHNVTREENVTYQYRDDGEYQVLCSVVDDDGDNGTETFTLIVDNRAPEVEVELNTTKAKTCSPVRFSVQAEDPDGFIDRLEFDFQGDGTWENVTSGLEVEHQYQDDGKYKPLIRAYDDDGAYTEVEGETVTIVNRPPAVRASVASTEVTTLKEITFDIEGEDLDGEIVEYKWDFEGDGEWDYSSSTTPRAKHTYMDDGTYSARVYTRDDDGAETVDAIDIEVLNSPPEVELNVNPLETYTGEEITFSWEAEDRDGSIVHMEWDFDGNGYKDWSRDSDKTDTLIHSYSDNDDYVAIFKVKDDDNDVTVERVNVTINNRPPELDLSLSSSQITAGHSVEITAEASDADGYIVEYRWDIDGDGSWDEITTSGYLEQVYDVIDTYDIVVEAEDDDEAVTTRSVELTVVANQPPIADAGPDSEAYIGISVAFDGSSSYDPDGDPLVFKWDFDGDGSYDWNSESTASTSHSFSTEGVYTSELWVSDGVDHATDEKQVTIKVNHAPVADAGPDQSVDAGDTVNFDGSGSYDPDDDALTYSWDFGDSNYGSGELTSHMYQGGGTYTVTLTVTDEGDMSDSDTLSVQVTGPDKFAIVIGIADYPGSGSDLQYPDDDAYGWESYLKARDYTLVGPQSGGQFTEEPFIDSQATKSAIMAAVNHIANTAPPDAEIVFTYSGHGYNYDDLRNNYGSCPYSGQGSLMTIWEDSPVYVSDVGIFDVELGNAWSSLTTQEIFLFFDCCRSGDYDDDVGGPNRYVAEACGVNEYSLDDPYTYHGAFTYGFLVDGLNTHPAWDCEAAFDNAYDYCSTSFGGSSFHPEETDGDPGTSYIL